MLLSTPSPRVTRTECLVLFLSLASAGCGSTSGSDTSPPEPDAARPADATAPAPGSDATTAPDASPLVDDAAPATPDAAAPGPDAGPAVPPLGALPVPTPVDVGRFMTHQACAFCHLGEQGLLTDADGHDISPVGTFLQGAMAHAARDPYYLAAFAAELAAAPPAARPLVEATCTRCHAPAASVEHAETGGHVAFDALVAGTADLDHLARDGVTCTACHQIQDRDLGTPASFTGGFSIGTERRIFGPYADPFTTPMRVHVNYTPTGSPHMGRSALCATCHTVITRALDAEGRPTGPEFPEQTAYLEWRNSEYRTEDEPGGTGGRSRSCQDCHMPTTDRAGRPLRTIISIRPSGLDERAPFRRHEMFGGNAWLPRLLAASPTKFNAAAGPELLEAAATETERFAATAANVLIESAGVREGALTATVLVENLTGHKLPTGYPTRRLFLEWRLVDAAGATLLGAGTPDGEGVVAGLDGAIAHRDVVASTADIPAWGTILEDVDGRPTHLLLRAARFRLDNRILPRGWRDDHDDAGWTRPAGVDPTDADFTAGSDRVHFQVPTPEGAAHFEVTLWLQAASPTDLGHLYAAGTAAGERLRAAARRAPPRPVRLATHSVGL